MRIPLRHVRRRGRKYLARWPFVAMAIVVGTAFFFVTVRDNPNRIYSQESFNDVQKTCESRRFLALPWRL